jgi:hypothetical protein
VLLKDYKRKGKINVQELADRFGTSHQNMYNWIKSGAVITGKKGERVIKLTKELARECEQ